MCIILENLVNVDLIFCEVGGDFYCCQILVFEVELNCMIGMIIVCMMDVIYDNFFFWFEYEFDYFVVNVEGYVKYLNVFMIVEIMDMCEVMCSYEVNFNMIENYWCMFECMLDFLCC